VCGRAAGFQHRRRARRPRPGLPGGLPLWRPSPAVAGLIRQKWLLVREVTSPPRLALSFEGILHGNCAFPMRSRKA
jgi:hypothetical protein